MINFPLSGSSWRKVQGFGERPSVYAQFGMKGHNGLDMAPPVPGQTGVVVYAPHEGYVTIPAFEPHGYGNHVKIQSLPYLSTGETRQSTLAHFASLNVTAGQFVHQGDPIGIMGMTGFADGIHCHWTYKKLIGGTVQDYTNGFYGAIDILPYCCHWNP